MSADGRFVGEGQLSWMSSLGGKSALLPVAAGLLVISAMTAVDRVSSFSLALGAMVPIWFAWRRGIPQAFARTLRRGRPSFRVELDDLGARTFDPAGKATSELEWFELESFYTLDYGLVLMMRVAKNGANAIIVPKAFFAETEWPAILSLVREKLPGSAKAHDDAAAQAIEQRGRARRQIVPRLLLAIALLAVLYWLVQSTR